MNPYQQMMEKTGLKVTGLVKSLNEFTPKEEGAKTFHSMDLDLKGQKMPLTVSIPQGVDRSKYQVGELVVDLKVVVQTYQGKTRFSILGG